MGREVVVAVTNGRLDGSTEGFDRALGVSSIERSAEGLAEIFGTWERIFSGQAGWLARESWRPPAEADIGQDHRRVVAISQPRTHTLYPYHG